MKLFKKKQQKKVESPNNQDIMESEEKSIWEEADLLELDYITTIYDVANDLKEQNEECSMGTSQVAGKIDCNEKDIQGAIVHLDDIGKSFLCCIEKLNDMILKNKTSNKNIIQAMDDIINSVEMLLINIDRNNRNFINELEEFCTIANSYKININKIESLIKQIQLVTPNARVQDSIECENGNGSEVMGGGIKKLVYQSEEYTDELTKAICSINESVLNSEQLLKDTSNRVTNEGEKLKDITETIKTSIIENTNESINTYKMINKEVYGSITQVDIVNKELITIAKLITDEINSISDICKKQVEQQINISRIIELSKQLKNIKSN